MKGEKVSQVRLLGENQGSSTMFQISDRGGS